MPIAIPPPDLDPSIAPPPTKFPSESEARSLGIHGPGDKEDEDEDPVGPPPSDIARTLMRAFDDRAWRGQRLSGLRSW
jgi:hypothetical protein